MGTALIPVSRSEYTHAVDRALRRSLVGLLGIFILIGGWRGLELWFGWPSIALYFLAALCMGGITVILLFCAGEEWEGRQKRRISRLALMACQVYALFAMGLGGAVLYVLVSVGSPEGIRNLGEVIYDIRTKTLSSQYLRQSPVGSVPFPTLEEVEDFQLAADEWQWLQKLEEWEHRHRIASRAGP